MGKKWGVYERRVEIMRVLESRRRETMANFARLFGVSIRTICYDIEILTVIHPIETVTGRGGCVKLQEDYRTHQKILSQEQQDVLIEIIPLVNKRQARVIKGLLVAHGSKPNCDRITGLII